MRSRLGSWSPRLALVAIMLTASTTGLAIPSTAATAAGGRILWTASIAGGVPRTVAVSPDGTRTFVIGCAPGTTSCDLTTVAYRTGTGAVLWEAQFAGPSHQSGVTAHDIVVSADGRFVYVSAAIRPSLSDYGDFTTLAYDAITGRRLWVATYGASTNDFPCCIGVSADGSTVFVTGEVFGIHGFDFATLGYDAASGALLWVTKYDGPASGYDNPHGLGVSPTGNVVYVTGESPGDVYNDYATIAYDGSTGAQLWLARYNSGGTRGDTPYALRVDPAGARVYVTGCSGTFDYCVLSDYATVAYDSATGAQLWISTYNGPVDGVDIATDIGVSPDGDLVYVTGSSDGLSSTDYTTIAYDAATGVQTWLAALDDPQHQDNYPCCLAVSPEGSKVTVTGYTYLTTGSEWLTVTYDAISGAQRWTARFAGSGGGQAQGLALVPNGTLALVVGSTNTTTSTDFATVAYRA